MVNNNFDTSAYKDYIKHELMYKMNAELSKAESIDDPHTDIRVSEAFDALTPFELSAYLGGFMVGEYSLNEEYYDPY